MAWLATAGCHSTYSHGEEPTPSAGTIQPAVLTPVVAADGVTTSLYVEDAYVGATYAGATTAFLLQETITVDGTPLPAVAAQYQLTLGNPGSGTYDAAYLIPIGVLSAGTHTISITITSPQDFVGTNAGAASTTVVITPVAAPG